MGRGKYSRDFRMGLKLNDHQLKIGCYKKSLVYMEHMVIADQKPMRDAQEIKRKQSKQHFHGKKAIRIQEKRARKAQRTLKTIRRQLIKWQ